MDGPIEPERKEPKCSPRAAEGTALAELAAVPVVNVRMRFPAPVRALRNRNFRLFWSGNFLSNIGSWMENVARGWLVLLLTNSAFWLGLVGFAGSIPFLFFTLFGGVFADRVDKRRLLLVTQTTMMILAFVLATLAWLKVITVWEVAAIAFLNGVTMSMNAPSYQAMVPRLVENEDLTNAIALNSAQFNMSRILGPTLGGYAMAIFGVAGNFFLNGVSFLAVIAALTRIRYPEAERSHQESVWQSLRSGFAYLHSERQMRVLVYMTAVVSFLGIPFLTFIPYFAKVQLNLGASGLGWLLACSGLGAVLGAMTIAVKGVIRRRGQVLTGCGILFFAAIIGICYSYSFALSASLALVEGYNGILMISCFNVSLQHLSSDEMRGRMMSIYATSFLGLPPLGTLLAAELSRHIPTGHALAMMSGMAALGFVGFYLFSPSLRTLD
ncbi:MAG TPA: MFS transporter [Terracidiphilus sp.]|nr:MFS transporter [Terracidiphilus sp.]